MPGSSDSSLVTFKGWTLRIRASVHPSPRLLLLIHGLTGDENSMWVFARGLPDRYWLLAPRAPHLSQHELGGYSWSLSRSGGEERPTFEQLQSAAASLIELADDYAASSGLNARTFDVMGFSQGAAVCSSLAFLYPERIRRLALLAGFVPDGSEARLSERPLTDKAVFIAHGTRDETVNVERAHHAVHILEQAGATVTYCEDDTGHKVSLTCLRALQEFLADTRNIPLD